MSGFLFVTWSGGGNLTPALGIAGALERRGHRATFIGHADQAAAIVGAGFHFHAFEPGVCRPLAEEMPEMPAATQHLRVFTDAGLARAVAALVDAQSFDLIVVDHLLWAVLRELSDRDRPFATLVTTLYGQQRDSWTRGRGAAVARQFGYSPVELWHRGRLVVAVTLPELDPPEPGVLISGPAWQGSPRPAPPRVDPAVLVSLSTLAQAGQTRVIQRILDALGALPVRATVTTGRGVDPAALRPPANSRVVPYAPHEKLLPQMSLVISHGGHSTAMAALARDLPLLLPPMFSLSDQPAVARALADRGVALTLPKEAGSREIRTAVETLLGDPAYRTAAAALGAAIRRRDGADVAADALVAAAPGSPPGPTGTVEPGPAPVQPGRPRGGRPSLPNRIMEFEGRQVLEE